MKTQRSFFSRLIAFLSPVFLAGIVVSARGAGTDTWAGSNGTNWTAVGAFTPNDPASGDLLLFTGTTAGASSVDNETNGFSLGGITFASTAQAYTISGNTLNLTGTVESDSANTETISDALTTATNGLTFKTTAGGTLSLGAFAQSVNNIGTNFQGTGNFIVGGLSTTGGIGDIDNFQNTGNVTVTGPIAQSSGGGVITVNMGNTGTTTISGNVGTGTGSSSNSTVTFNFTNSNTTTIGGNIVTGNDVGSVGAVNINLGVIPTYAAPTPALYTGKVTLSGTNDFFGTVTVNSGTLVTASATALKSTLPTVINGAYNGVILTLNGGTLDLDGTTQSVRYLNSIAPLDYTNFTPNGGTITNNGSTLATLVDEEGGTTTFGGSITDGTAQTAVTFESASYQDYVYLTGNNTYTGATTIKSMGVVEIGAETSLQYGLNSANYTYGALSATTPIIIQAGNAGATAALGTYPGTLIMGLSSDYTLSNLLSGSGRILFEGTGTTTLNNTNTFNGSVVVNSGTTVLDFSGANSPTDGNNVLYHGATYAISKGVSSTGSASGAQTMALGNGYQLSNAAGANYVPVAVGDYLFANGALGIVTSVNTSNNTFTIVGNGGAQALESAVLYAATGQVATASVTSGTATITSIDYSSLQVGEGVAITLNGTTTVSSIKSIDTTTGVVTLNNAFGGTGTATLAFDNAIENAVYMGAILNTNGLTPTATATNPGQANLDIQGGNGGISTQTIGYLDLSGVSGGTGLGGANGSSGNASNITLLPGTGGNKVVLNIGYLTGGAGGGSALNFTLPTNPDGTLASNALITIADPTFNSSPRGNSSGTNTDFYVIPYLNGRQQITINGNDFAAVDTVSSNVVALSSLSNSVATTASNYFQYAYTTVTAATNGASPADPSYGNIDVMTGGGTATLTSGGANAYRFNEANKGDTLTFNQVNTTTGLGTTSYLSNLLVTSAVGANTTDINGTSLTFSTGAGGTRITDIFQNNPNGLLEIDNNLSNTVYGIAKEGPGTVVFTASDAEAQYTGMQGMTVVTGNAVAPSFVFGTTSATSNVITFTTPNATAGLYVGESLGVAGANGFITSLNATTNTATISQNYGTTNTTAVSLNFVGGGGLGAPGAGIAINNGATLMLGSGNIKLVTTGAVDNTDGSLFANQAITNNGVLQINWTGSTNSNTNNNTLNNAITGIGQLVLATPSTGTMTLTVEGNNSYAGGTFINNNTTLVLHQAAAGTASGSYTLGSNVATFLSTAGLAVGETITSTDLGTSGASGTATILAINGNNVTLNIAATGTGSGVAVTTNAYGANALALGGNRDSGYGTTGDVGYGVTVNGNGVLDLGGYYLNPGSTTVDNYIAGYLTLNGGTVQDGILQLYFGANLYSGTEAANTSIANGYTQYIQGLTKSTSGTANMWGLNTYVNNGTNDVVTISGGVLNFATNGVNWNGGTASGLGAESNAATSLVLDGGTLQYTGKTVVLASDGVTAGSTTNPLLNTNGTATAIQKTDRLFTITQNGGTIDSSADYAIQFTGTGANVSSGTGNRTLTLTGSNAASALTGTTSIASTLSDAGVGSTLAVNKTGTGAWSMNGNSSYTGGTTVTKGALLVNNTTGSATGTGQVSVLNGATFGGGNGAATSGATLTSYGASSGIYHASLQNYTLGKAGIVTGLVDVANGAALQPGNLSTVGTLTVGSLTLEAGSILNYDFNATANSFVAVTATGGLTLVGIHDITVNLFQDGTSDPFNQVGVYNILSYKGTFNGDLTALTANLPGVYTFVNDTADGIIQLDITSVPEPSTWVLMLLGGLGMLITIRRSRSRGQS